jgi:hypothetical protein
MAKVNLPLLSAEVSGKFANIVFFKRGAMQIARIKTKPSNPNTEKQRIVRENMKGLGALWKNAGNDYTVTLHKRTTDDSGNVVYQDVQVNAQNLDRTQWESCTIYNKEGYPLKGYQVFASVNLRRLMEGMDIALKPADAGLECS